MDNIAVVGDASSVLAFRAMGVDVFTPVGADQVRQVVDQLAKQQYGVIFLTEEMAAMIPETVGRYRNQVKPAIILIPNHSGSLGLGMADIQQNVEKAVGMNIFK